METFEYSIARMRRRTLVLTVRGGAVEVKAPFGVSDDAVARFVESKRSWIEARLREKAAQYPAVQEGKTLLDAGIERRVVYGAVRNSESEEGFSLKDAQSVRRFFERTRGPLLVEALYSWSVRTGLYAEDVKLCDFKARWGSCGSDGCIKLNWRLAMLPVPLRDYVLIHELCHLKEMNHSAAFWREVQKWCPDFRARRKQLKGFGFLTLLYRR